MFFVIKAPLRLLVITLGITAVSAMPAEDHHGHHSSHHRHSYSHHSHSSRPSYAIPAVDTGASLGLPTPTFDVEITFTPRTAYTEAIVPRATSHSASIDISVAKTISTSSHKSTTTSSVSSFPDGNYSAFPTYNPFPTRGIEKRGGAAGFRGAVPSPDTNPPSYDSVYGGDSSSGDDSPDKVSKSHSHRPSKTTKRPSSTKRSSATSKEEEEEDVPFALGGGLFPYPQGDSASHTSSHEPSSNGSSWTVGSGGSKMVVAVVLLLLGHGIF